MPSTCCGCCVDPGSAARKLTVREIEKHEHRSERRFESARTLRDRKVRLSASNPMGERVIRRRAQANECSDRETGPCPMTHAGEVGVEARNARFYGTHERDGRCRAQEQKPFVYSLGATTVYVRHGRLGAAGLAVAASAPSTSAPMSATTTAARIDVTSNLLLRRFFLSKDRRVRGRRMRERARMPT